MIFNAMLHWQVSATISSALPVMLSGSGSASAAAQACLDLLRGARVLIKQNRDDVVRAAKAESAEAGIGAVETMQGLARELNDILEEVDGGSVTDVTSGQMGLEAQRRQHRVKRSRDDHMLTHGFTASVSSTSHTGEDGAAAHGSSCATGDSNGIRMMPSARAQVLGSPELLTQIMTLLVKGEQVYGTVVELSKQSLVCRLWRGVARSQELWKPLAERSMPLISTDDAKVSQGLLAGAGGSYHKYYVHFCQLQYARNGLMVLDEQSWACHLRLIFHVCNARTQTVIVNVESDLRVREIDGEATIVHPSNHATGYGAAFTTASQRDEAADADTDMGMFLAEEANNLFIVVILLHCLNGRSAMIYDNRSVWNRRYTFVEDDGTSVQFEGSDLAVASVAYGPSALNVRMVFKMRLQEGTNAAGAALPEEHKVWQADVRSCMLRLSTPDGLGPAEVDVARFLYAALGL